MSIADQLPVLVKYAQELVDLGFGGETTAIVPMKNVGTDETVFLTNQEIVDRDAAGTLAGLFTPDVVFSQPDPDINAALDVATSIFDRTASGDKNLVVTYGPDVVQGDTLEGGTFTPDPVSECGDERLPFTVASFGLDRQVVDKIDGLQAFGTVIAAEVQIRNDTVQTEPVRISAFIDTVAIDKATSRKLRTLGGGDISSGQTKTFVLPFTGREIADGDTSGFAEGTYHIGVVVDRNSAIAGDQLPCNSGDATFDYDTAGAVAPALGRYFVSNLSVSPALWGSGSSVRFAVDVTNEGDAALSGGFVVIGADARQNGAAEPPFARGYLPLVSIEIPDLAAGETARIGAQGAASAFATSMYPAGQFAVGNWRLAPFFEHEIRARVDADGQPEKTSDLNGGAALVSRHETFATIRTTTEFNQLIFDTGVRDTGSPIPTPDPQPPEAPIDPGDPDPTPTPPDPVPGPDPVAPVAFDDTVTTDEDTQVVFNVLTNDSSPDGSPLTLVHVSTPSNGSVTSTAAGEVTYTPDTGFSGTDQFVYTVSNVALASSGTIRVTVKAASPGPGPTPPTTGLPTKKSDFGLRCDILSVDVANPTGSGAVTLSLRLTNTGVVDIAGDVVLGVEIRAGFTVLRTASLTAVTALAPGQSKTVSRQFTLDAADFLDNSWSLFVTTTVPEFVGLPFFSQAAAQRRFEEGDRQKDVTFGIDQSGAVVCENLVATGQRFFGISIGGTLRPQLTLEFRYTIRNTTTKFTGQVRTVPFSTTAGPDAFTYSDIEVDQSRSKTVSLGPLESVTVDSKDNLPGTQLDRWLRVSVNSDRAAGASNAIKVPKP